MAPRAAASPRPADAAPKAAPKPAAAKPAKPAVPDAPADAANPGPHAPKAARKQPKPGKLTTYTAIRELLTESLKTAGVDEDGRPTVSTGAILGVLAYTDDMVKTFLEASARVAVLNNRSQIQVQDVMRGAERYGFETGAPAAAPAFEVASAPTVYAAHSAVKKQPGHPKRPDGEARTPQITEDALKTVRAYIETFVRTLAWVAVEPVKDNKLAMVKAKHVEYARETMGDALSKAWPIELATHLAPQKRRRASKEARGGKGAKEAKEAKEAGGEEEAPAKRRRRAVEPAAAAAADE